MSLLRIAALCLALLLPAASPLPPQAAQSALPPVQIGVLANRGAEACLEQWAPLAHYLDAAVPEREFRIVPLDFDEIEQATARRSIHFVLANPALYALLEKRHGVGRIVTLKNKTAGQIDTYFAGVLFHRADRPDIHDWPDLAGRRLAAVSPLSLGGWLMQRLELQQRGFDTESDFQSLEFLGNHETVVEHVLEGKADVGAVRSGIIEDLLARGRITPGALAILPAENDSPSSARFLRSTRDYPEWPLARLNHTPLELAEHVASALLVMPQDHPACRAGGYGGWSIPLNYEPVHALLRELRAPPYDRQRRPSLGEALSAHRGPALAVLATLLAFLALGLWSLRLNLRLRKSLQRQKRHLEQQKYVEDVLRQTEQNLKDAQVLAGLGSWTWTLHNDRFHWSEELYRILGYPERDSEPTRAELLERIHPEDLDRFAAFMRSLRQGQPHDPFEHRVLAPDGTPRWVHAVGKTVHDSQGRPIEVRGILHDVTEDRQREQRLRDNEQRLRGLVQNLVDALYVLDTDSACILECNEQACRDTGYSREELLGKPMSEIEVGQNAREIRQTFEYQDGESSKLFHGIHQRKDGSRFPVEVRSCTMEWEGRRVQMGVARNISQRRQYEDERTRLTTALEQAHETIIVTDAEGAILYANPFFEQLTGYSREEALGQNPRILKSGRHTPEFYADIWRTLKQGKVWKGRITNRKKNGEIFEEEATMSPVRDETGRIAYFVAVKRDITEVAQLESQLRQSQKMEAIGTLAGGIAHDFNNILYAIQGYAEMSLEDLDDRQALSESLDEINRAARRAGELVQQILTFSRQKEEQKAPLAIQNSVKEALRLLRGSLPVTIEFEQHINPRCLPVLADPTQIHQVVMNLCTNAYHAMRPHHGRLSVSLDNYRLEHERSTNTALLAPGPYVLLEIADTGHGMTPEILERIFLPYFTTKKTGEGTGMGMAVVHGIVQNHGGGIEVESRPGQGTRFRLYFPAHLKDAPATPQPDEPHDLPSGSENLMLVDDEESIVKIAGQMLRRQGYRVQTFHSPRAALQAFQANPDAYDALITDQTMPELTGSELAARIWESRPGLPVLLCTGFSDILDEDSAKSLGIREYILKPIVRKDLLAAVRRLFSSTVNQEG